MRNNGLTGILRPTGEFIPCNYGNHGVISVTIPTEEELDCIYFSGSYNNRESILYLNENLTNQQIKWFIENIDYLDETQYNVWKEYINKKVR